MDHAVLAIDVGGKSIKTGFINRSGDLEVLDSYALPFEPNPSTFFHLLHDAIQNALRDGEKRNLKIDGIGIGIPGRVDGATGIAYEATNLGWPETNFKELIEGWTGLSVFVDHDVRCGAIAENVFGALKGHKDFLYIAIGTGIGAGISIRGETYSGHRSFGGEIGHAIVYPGGRRCLCGKFGCLEAYCSAKQIEMQYTEATGQYITCAEVAERAKNGCQISREIWNHAIEALAFSLMNYVMILQPTKIVIGGGVSQAGEDLLLHPVKRKMREISEDELIPELSLSSMKQNSALIGAGYQVYLSGK